MKRRAGLDEKVHGCSKPGGKVEFTSANRVHVCREISAAPEASDETKGS